MVERNASYRALATSLYRVTSAAAQSEGCQLDITRTSTFSEPESTTLLLPFQRLADAKALQEPIIAQTGATACTRIVQYSNILLQFVIAVDPSLVQPTTQ